MIPSWMNRASLRRATGRFIALYGWQPLGILCAGVLLFALAMDQLRVEQDELTEHMTALEKKSRDMTRKTGQQKQWEATLKEKRERLAREKVRGFSAATAEQASAQLLGELQALAAAAQAKPLGGSAMPPRRSGAFAAIRAEGEIEAPTRSLVHLLESLVHAPRVMKITRLDVRVPDVEQPATLMVKLAVESFHAAPEAAARKEVPKK
jgi:hypothetical protein